MNNLSYHYTTILFVFMDSYLADMLINNIISNAIKHSKKEKNIEIQSNENSLIISNYGEKEIANPTKLFLRFYRESNVNQSTGLGLAIAKKICDLYEFNISYKFKNHHHIFSVTFNK